MDGRRPRRKARSQNPAYRPTHPPIGHLPGETHTRGAWTWPGVRHIVGQDESRLANREARRASPRSHRPDCHISAATHALTSLEDVGLAVRAKAQNLGVPYRFRVTHVRPSRATESPELSSPREGVP